MNTCSSFNTSDVHYLTSQDDKRNLNRLFKSSKLKFIGLNSGFVRRLNRKIIEEFSLNEKGNESQGLRDGMKESQTRNYQSIDAFNDDQTPAKRRRLRPKKHLLRLLRSFHIIKNEMYEELKSSKENEEKNKNKKKKLVKKLKKITIDACSNLSTSVHLMNGTYNYPDQFYGFNYDQYDHCRTSMNYNDYNSYKYATDYAYSTSPIIYGPRYM